MKRSRQAIARQVTVSRVRGASPTFAAPTRMYKVSHQCLRVSSLPTGTGVTITGRSGNGVISLLRSVSPYWSPVCRRNSVHRPSGNKFHAGNTTVVSRCCEYVPSRQLASEGLSVPITTSHGGRRERKVASAALEAWGNNTTNTSGSPRRIMNTECRE